MVNVLPTRVKSIHRKSENVDVDRSASTLIVLISSFYNIENSDRDSYTIFNGIFYLSFQGNSATCILCIQTLFKTIHYNMV